MISSSTDKNDEPHDSSSAGGKPPFLGARRRLPLIMQNAPAECGLACLAMIANYYGHNVTLTYLRQRLHVSLRGLDLRQLMLFADQLHLSTRAIKLEMEGLRVLIAPCILHWNMTHFVVLKAVSRQWFVIHDPARGIRKLTHAEVSAHFTGIALELTPNLRFVTTVASEKLALSSFWKGTVGIKSFLTQLLILSATLQFFSILSPLYMQAVVDKILLGFGNSGTLLALALAFSMLLLVKELIGAIRSYLVSSVGTSFSLQLNTALLRHLLRLPLFYFQTRHIGDVVSRFGSLDQVKTLLSEDIINVLLDAAMVITASVLMFSYSAVLSAIVLIAVIGHFAVQALLYFPIRRLTEERMTISAANSTNFMETIRAIQSIKIFGRELDRQQLWQSYYTRQSNLDDRVGRWRIAQRTAENLIFGLENIAVVYLAARLIMTHRFTVGMLTAFLAYQVQFTGAVSHLVTKWLEYKMLGLHLDRIADIALTEPERERTDTPALAEPPMDVDSAVGQLTLEHVWFSYGPGAPDLIRDVSVTIRAGESIALTGPSGCGKTTLLKIAMGLLDPQRGAIKLDGCDIRVIGKTNYRKAIASVMQDDELLSGSMADNIAFFDAEPDQPHIESCAVQAAIHDDIKRMPMGYRSLIGDMGKALSGGQKQRLLLARALYARPKILFLDEATSHLDADTEMRVNDAIRRLNITRIVVAHRQETVRCADRVLSLQAIQTGFQDVIPG